MRYSTHGSSALKSENEQASYSKSIKAIPYFPSQSRLSDREKCVRSIENAIAEAYTKEGVSKKVIDQLWEDKKYWENPNVSQLEFILAGKTEAYWTMDKRLSALNNYLNSSNYGDDTERCLQIKELYNSLKKSKGFEKFSSKKAEYSANILAKLENYIDDISQAALEQNEAQTLDYTLTMPKSRFDISNIGSPEWKKSHATIPNHNQNYDPETYEANLLKPSRLERLEDTCNLMISPVSIAYSFAKQSARKLSETIENLPYEFPKISFNPLKIFSKKKKSQSEFERYSEGIKRRQRIMPRLQRLAAAAMLIASAPFIASPLKEPKHEVPEKIDYITYFRSYGSGNSDVQNTEYSPVVYSDHSDYSPYSPTLHYLLTN